MRKKLDIPPEINPVEFMNGVLFGSWQSAVGSWLTED